MEVSGEGGASGKRAEEWGAALGMRERSTLRPDRARRAHWAVVPRGGSRVPQSCRARLRTSLHPALYFSVLAVKTSVPHGLAVSTLKIYFSRRDERP